MQMERMSLRGTPEIAGLQTGTNCFNNLCKEYEGKKRHGGIKLQMLK